MSTLRELFAHNDWARDKLMTLAAGLSEAQLDQPFEIGCGAVRESLRHLYGAERIWFERWQGGDLPQYPHSRDIVAMDELWSAFRALAAARDAQLDALAEGDLQHAVTYTDPHGQRRTVALGDLLLHVCNHGFHHRAQVLNMLRRLGVTVSGLDFLFMKLERPTVAQEPAVREQMRELGRQVAEGAMTPQPLDLAAIRPYFAYADWATERLHATAEELNDEQLDRSFEMGLGTLRKTLLHIRDGEAWWHENWTSPSPGEFPKLGESTSIAELKSLFRETTDKRNAYIETLRDEDLQRVVTAEVRPGVTLRFRLGESLLQLCGHGTHHRAQALNMLRRLGAEVPALDYVYRPGCASPA